MSSFDTFVNFVLSYNLAGFFLQLDLSIILTLLFNILLQPETLNVNIPRLVTFVKDLRQHLPGILTETSIVSSNSKLQNIDSKEVEVKKGQETVLQQMYFMSSLTHHSRPDPLLHRS